jgi:hypothetical protein
MNIRTPKLLLQSVFILCVLGTAFSAKPNVVFIMADDLGWADTTLYGHTALYETPNLERSRQAGNAF